MVKFYCLCGQDFSTRRQLTEHVGLLNPHWPRSSADDKHGAANDEHREVSAIQIRKV